MMSVKTALMKRSPRTFCPINTLDSKEIHMKKLNPFAAFALATAVTALGSGTVLAQDTTNQDLNTGTQTTQTQRDQDMYSTPKSKPTTKPSTSTSTIPSDQSSQRAKDVVSQTPAADRANKPDHAGMERMEHRGYVDTTPVNGVQASDLIGAEVKTKGGENVGPVDDLIIDENGQIVAILIGVGGFLNMGQKDVAIGWDDVTRSGDADDQLLTIDMTRDDLRPAPEYARQD